MHTHLLAVLRSIQTGDRSSSGQQAQSQGGCCCRRSTLQSLVWPLPMEGARGGPVQSESGLPGWGSSGELERCVRNRHLCVCVCVCVCVGVGVGVGVGVCVCVWVWVCIELPSVCVVFSTAHTSASVKGSYVISVDHF